MNKQLITIMAIIILAASLVSCSTIHEEMTKNISIADTISDFFGQTEDDRVDIDEEPKEDLLLTDSFIGTCPKRHPESLCWFYVTDKENCPTRISYQMWGTPGHAGRIAELMRDKDGIISKTPSRVLIVPLQFDRTINALLFYLNDILGHNFSVCDDEPKFPCLLTTRKGESYRMLANRYYEGSNWSEVVKRLERANDIDFYLRDTGLYDLRPVENFPSGTIVFMPTRP